MHPNFEEYEIEFIPLSYIHIGSGIEYDPLSYVIKDKILYRFEIQDLFELLNDKQKEEFAKISDESDLIKIKSFIKEHFNPECAKYKINVSENIEKKYNEKWDSIENSLYIEEQIKEGINYLPYIPGSSMKGAIRTAILNVLENIKKEEGLFKDRNVNKYEGNILDALNRNGYLNAKRDPFRFIVVRDCLIKDENVLNVKEIKNYKPGRVKNDEIINMDITKEIIDYKSSKPYEFNISINKKFIDKKEFYAYDRKTKKKYLLFKLNKPIDINVIRDSCNVYYKAVYKYEKEKFYNNIKNIYSEIKDYYDFLDKKINSIDENREFLIKIGRYKHIEATTFNFNFNPDQDIYGTSRFLVDGKYPLGWVVLKIKNNDLKNPDYKISVDEMFRLINKKVEKSGRKNSYRKQNNYNERSNNRNYNQRNQYEFNENEIRTNIFNNFRNTNNIRKQETIDKLNSMKDEIIEGPITNITNFGIFVNINRISDGLVHKKNLGDFSLDNFKVGDKVKVKIENVEYNSKRNKIEIKLSLVEVIY